MSSPHQVPHSSLDTDSMMSAAYAELRRVARQRCANLPPGQTLSATALVHEVWMRMEAGSSSTWASRAQFFAAVGTLMRNILVDRARAKSSLKRGGDRKRVELSHQEPGPDSPSDELTAVNEALTKLEGEDPRAAQLVTLRFFVGMTVDEAAAALEISPRTARRDWAFAQAYLYEALTGDEST